MAGSRQQCDIEKQNNSQLDMGHLKKEESEGNEGTRKAITCPHENGTQRRAKVQNLFAYSWTYNSREV